MTDPRRDLVELREAVLFEGPDESGKRSRFWLLLVLASIIAATGVVADSAATVIGAMLVAPLRVPIMGTTLAVVLRDRRNLWRAVGLVVTGALATVAVGYVIGLTVLFDLSGATNDQISTWSHAGLIDLVAALAVGAVGAIALVREDIGDAVPGVAIAISLVPPLTVVGLTLESRSWADAVGALLLFATNVAAILAVGVVVLIVYGIRPVRHRSRDELDAWQAYGGIVALLLVITGLLAQASWSAARQTIVESNVSDVVGAWAAESGWELVSVDIQADGVVAHVVGPLPVPDAAGLGASLTEAGVEPDTVEVQYQPRITIVDD